MSSNASDRRVSEKRPIQEDPFRITLPDAQSNHDQDAEFCILELGNEKRKVRFHDYAEIYDVAGLYERLFYDLLACNSPAVVASLLGTELRRAGVGADTLRVLDLGAGNGIVAEELVNVGVSHVVGADLLPEAAAAALRDRPHVYADYQVADLTALSSAQHEALREHRLNGLTCVAALGFGDIPPAAFAAAFNFVADDGWIAFTLRDRFLSERDSSGFGRLIKRCVDTGVIEVRASERYRHRLSMTGEPLYYSAMIARKKRDIPASYIE